MVSLEASRRFAFAAFDSLHSIASMPTGRANEKEVIATMIAPQIFVGFIVHAIERSTPTSTTGLSWRGNNNNVIHCARDSFQINATFKTSPQAELNLKY
mmetsp:Transcript_31285/g.56703  ORF Transcript_31285/g.56703 Transcript_31285/m.56703 type:complete len:99 (-) Transcript_31285:469-765(-)